MGEMPLYITCYLSVVIYQAFLLADAIFSSIFGWDQRHMCYDEDDMIQHHTLQLIFHHDSLLYNSKLSFRLSFEVFLRYMVSSLFEVLAYRKLSIK